MSELQKLSVRVSFKSAVKAAGGRREMAIHLAVLVALSLLLCVPVLLHGAPDLSHDGIYHAIWAKQFATQFWHGDWFPRWFSDINAGFGGPSGFFYPPLTSYGSSLFWPFMAAHDPWGWLMAGYSLVLAEVLSGITAYLWLRALVRPRAALLGAVVYVIAPYHLAIDLYQRGASAEFWVFVWFPLVMLSADGLLRGSHPPQQAQEPRRPRPSERWAVPGAALSYALAILSHPTVALCFAPIVVGYVFFFSESTQRVRATALMVAGLALGVGLNGIYLLPAMLDQHKAYVSMQTETWGDFHNEWLWQSWRELLLMGQYVWGAVIGEPVMVAYDTPFKLRTLVLTLATLAAIAGLFLVIRKFEPARRTRRIALFWVGVALLYFFLMTNFSVLIWETVPFLRYLQFPFRLNVMLVVCVTALAAMAGPYLWQRGTRIMTLFLALIAVGSVGADVWVSTQVFSAWRAVPDKTERNQEWQRTQMEFTTLWPKGPDMKTLEKFPAFDRFVAEHPPKSVELVALSSRQLAGVAHIESWRPRRVMLSINAPGDSVLTLNHFYYDGWQGRINGAANVLPAGPSPDGLIQLEVPQGDYELVVELPPDRAERLGMVISLLSLALVGGVAIRTGIASKAAGFAPHAV